MKWNQVRQKYPEQFVLLKDPIEESCSESTVRITEGTPVFATRELNAILKEYREACDRGEDVIYAVPTTPEEFLVIYQPFMGLLQ